MLSLLPTLLVLASVTAGLRAETKSAMRAAFEKYNTVLKGNKDEGTISVANLYNEYHHFSEGDDKWTFVMVAPRNNWGEVFAHVMLSEVQRLLRDFGFQRASLLLQYSLWHLFDMFYSENVNASTVAVTKNDNQLELVYTGQYWAGVFRNGVVIQKTPCNTVKQKNETLSLRYLFDFNPEGGYMFQDRKQVWNVEAGDILLILHERMYKQFKQIIRVAVSIAQGYEYPAPRLVSMLRFAFDVVCRDQTPLAAIEITA